MRIRWILWLALFVGLCNNPIALTQGTDTNELLRTADEMVEVTARLRGLEPTAPILKGVKSRNEISRYLNERVQEDYDQGRLRQEGKMLKKLGLIPATIDYREFILRLLTEQVGGFYDPDKKTLYLASWLPVDEQKPVMVHEITHALQDQHFDVEGILKEDRNLDNDDRVLAHQALLEGDGMAVMLDYFLEPVKRHFAELPNLAFVMRTQESSMQAQFAVFKSAPPFLQETLLFPYGYGASFLQQAWKQNPSWKSIDKIYSDLPASTEQIIHPEKYFTNRDEPKPVKAEAFAAQLGDNWKITYKNVFGEFSLGLLLSQHLTGERARRSVVGWGGDQVLLLENDSGKDTVFVSTLWDTAEDSEKFFAAMDEWFRLHYPSARRVNESPEGFSIVREGEFSALRREENAVRFVIGIPESDGRKLKDFLTDGNPSRNAG
jgi:hypothetical protein